MWKKFKNWLIKKLGGFTAPPIPTNTISYYVEKPILLSRSVYRVDPRDEVFECQIQDAIVQLAKELRDKGCIEKKTSYDIQTDTPIYQLIVRTFHATNPLEATTEHNEKEFNEVTQENNCYYENGFKKEIIYGERPAKDVRYPN